MGVSSQAPIGNDEWVVNTEGTDPDQPIKVQCMHTAIERFLGDRRERNIPYIVMLQNLANCPDPSGEFFCKPTFSFAHKKVFGGTLVYYEGTKN